MAMVKVLGILGVGLVACGGQASEPAASEEAGVATPVGSAQWHDETIDFYNTAGPGEEPSLLIARSGPMAGGDVLTQMQEQTADTVTAADLWHAVSPNTEIPDVLLEAHALTVSREGRGSAFIPFIQPVQAEVEKAVSINFNSMFTLVGEPAGHCFAGPMIGTRAVTAANAGAFVCTSHSPGLDQPNDFVRSGPIVTSPCPARLADTSAQRVGVLNEDPVGDVVINLCFYANGGQWLCGPNTVVHANFYQLADQAESVELHTVGMGARVVTGAKQGVSRLVGFGAARLDNSPPQFGLTTCGTF